MPPSRNGLSCMANVVCGPAIATEGVARFPTLLEANPVMHKSTRIRRQGATMMTYKAYRHFQSVELLAQLDRAERYATPEQFAAAARIAARSVTNARHWSRKFGRILTTLAADQR